MAEAAAGSAGGAGSEAATAAAGFEAMTFEQLVAELESIARQMAAGDIGIEAAADLYERAGALHAAAAERLARVQERIDNLAPPTPD
jgi:exodeoxyribonuclease VII small subunit